MNKYVDKINQIAKDCSQPNWDSYGALPITEEAVEVAIEFSHYLSDFPEAEVSPDTEGLIVFEWYISHANVFSIVVDVDEVLYYSGLLGDYAEEGQWVIDKDITNKIADKLALFCKLDDWCRK